MASKSSVPVSRKRGDVHEHADHMGGRWVSEKVPGTAAVAYLESAPDGGSLGKLIFKDIGDEKIVKEVEAIAKRFISWDNSKCLHSFKARYDGPRRLLGPLALTSYGEMVKVGSISTSTTTEASTTTETSATTEISTTTKAYYRSRRMHPKRWKWRRALKKWAAKRKLQRNSLAPEPERLTQEDGRSDPVHFMQVSRNGSHKEL